MIAAAARTQTLRLLLLKGTGSLQQHWLAILLLLLLLLVAPLW
jgi:hypothetical protein